MKDTARVQGATSFGAPPPPESVRGQMRRILEGASFQASLARRQFLRYVVEETLAGRSDRLTGSAIARSVFGREDGFDPQSDPVVRVEARRLRRDLDSYYVAAGARDPIFISIPKGGYIPHFEWRDVDASPVAPASITPAPLYPVPGGARSYRHRLIMALLAVGVVGVFGWVAAGLLDFGLISRSDRGEKAVLELPRGPKIAVAPFLSLDGDPEQAYFAHAIAEQFVTDLARFKALFVMSMPSAATDGETANPQSLGQKLGADYLLFGSVQRQESRIRLSTRLVDAKSGRVVWAESYLDKLTPENVFDIQEQVSQEVSAILAGRYGIIAQSNLSEAQHQPPTSLVAYDCVLRYYDYEKSFDQRRHAEVRACLERATELDPDYSDAWAILANIYAQEHRFGYNPRPEMYDSRERSRAAAERAVSIEPRNPTAQLMLANALFDRHDLAGFKAAGERAIALNPNDPEILAHFGTRLVYMGEWKRGVALVQKAIALDPEHPEWYDDPMIFYWYQMKDYDRALAELQGLRAPRLWRELFRTMILGQLGRDEEAKSAATAALRIEPDVGERFWDMARTWNVPDAHIEQMADGLRKSGLAGVPVTPPLNAIPNGSGITGRGAFSDRRLTG